MTLFTLGITLWAVVAGMFSLVAWARLSRLRAAAEPPLPNPAPPVLLLRPMDEPAPHELDALASPIDYPGPLEQVVLAPFRPRLPPSVRWLWSDPLTKNRKAGHLDYALQVLRTEGRVVLSVDADVAVDGALVRGLVAQVASGASLAVAAWLPVPRGGWGARALRAMLTHTHHSFLALDVMSRGAKSVSGKAMGLSPSARAEIPAVVDHIGEDLELARRLHARGETVKLTLVPARAPQPDGAPFKDSVVRIARWMRVLRAHRPGLFLTVPLFFCPSLLLFMLALVSRQPLALGGVAFFAAARTLLAARLLRLRPGVSRGPLDAFDWVLGEALLLSGFVRSLVGKKRVIWRGRAYALRNGGLMEPVQLTPMPGAGL